VAENTLPLFPLPKPALKHLLLPVEPKRVDFKGRGRGNRTIQSVDRAEHAALLKTQLESVNAWIKESIALDDIPEMTGIPIQLVTKPDYPLSTDDIHALTTQRGQKHGPPPVLLHSQQLVDAEGFRFTRVLLNVPFGGLAALQEKIRDFSTGNGTKGKRPYFANIVSIAPAAIEGLWTDPLDELPRDDTPRWWQFWVRKFPVDNRARFLAIADSLKLEIRGADLPLPDHYVFVARGSYTSLTSSIPLLDTLSELRAAHPCSLGLTQMKIIEQEDYVDEALARISFPPDNAPAVCLLDTGVNRGHRLLERLLSPSDNDTVFGDGDASDGYVAIKPHGHGTPMAGLAAYGDLHQLMVSTMPWKQLHRLESVRLFDPKRLHDPDNYGFITLQGVRRPEITQPNRRRVYCLAITAPGTDDGKPSAWSAAVDIAAYGDGNGSPRRVILISAGNIRPEDSGTAYTYPDENRKTPVEDPAQAWNAVTVGALTHRTAVTEDDDESRRLTPIVRERGALSPFSRTSCEWDPHWPIKPEIVLEGGNAAIHPQEGVEYRDSLQPTSTSALARSGKQFCPVNATSAATALASRLAAEITARYPELWPETIRGLLIHAARWTPVMLAGLDPHRAYNKKNNDRQRFIQVLRSYGYGEPDIERAYFSAQHATTLIREDTLTPYVRKGSTIKLSDCHIHRLPWPKALLADNYAATFTLRVTLSYYIAPNPSANNALKGSRYRYSGALLRFLVRNKEDYNDADFEQRLTQVAQDKDDTGEDNDLESLKTDPGWALGSKLCGKGGSLIHDVWRGSAADLAQMDRIAIFPAKGWWAYRKFPQGDTWHDCHTLPIRYSLLVSLEAEQDIPLYNEIQNQISVVLSSS
jgi:hypothetical protein